jgi:hypothetical protein
VRRWRRSSTVEPDATIAPMMFFVRAVVTGFGLTLGAAIFKKHVAHRLGLEENDKQKREDETLAQEAATDPGLHD